MVTSPQPPNDATPATPREASPIHPSWPQGYWEYIDQHGPTLDLGEIQPPKDVGRSPTIDSAAKDVSLAIINAIARLSRACRENEVREDPIENVEDMRKMINRLEHMQIHLIPT